MFAQPLDNGDWTGIGGEWYARQYGSSPPMPVMVIEDPAGDYLGWLDARDGVVIVGDTPPNMIQRKEIFSIQFPYGYKAEQDAGSGRAIPLRIETRD